MGASKKFCDDFKLGCSVIKSKTSKIPSPYKKGLSLIFEALAIGSIGAGVYDYSQGNTTGMFIILAVTAATALVITDGIAKTGKQQRQKLMGPK